MDNRLLARVAAAILALVLLVASVGDAFAAQPSAGASVSPAGKPLQIRPLNGTWD